MGERAPLCPGRRHASACSTSSLVVDGVAAGVLHRWHEAGHQVDTLVGQGLRGGCTERAGGGLSAACAAGQLERSAQQSLVCHCTCLPERLAGLGAAGDGARDGSAAGVLARLQIWFGQKGIPLGRWRQRAGGRSASGMAKVPTKRQLTWFASKNSPHLEAACWKLAAWCREGAGQAA